MILDRLDVSADDFERATGWSVKPQGACRGDLCVPLPAEARLDGGRLDVAAVADRLGMPLVPDGTGSADSTGRADAPGLYALGPETRVTGRALSTAAAPDLELPDFDGNPFRLSSLLGRKVLLVAWASW